MDLTCATLPTNVTASARKGGRNVPRTTLPDGLEALRVEMELGEVMRLIGKRSATTALFVLVLMG